MATPTTTVAEFFAGTPLGMQVHDGILDALADGRAFEVRVSKSQVAFRARRGFAWLWRPSMYLRNPGAQVVLSIALEREDPSPRFKQVAHPTPKYWQHHLEVHDVSEIDDEVIAWLREARTPPPEGNLAGPLSHHVAAPDRAALDLYP